MGSSTGRRTGSRCGTGRWSRGCRTSRCRTSRARISRWARTGGWRSRTRSDVVLMRQDPPFDLAYITASHLLERVHPKVLVVNDPVPRAQRAREDLRHRVPAPDAADAHLPRQGGDPGFPPRARRGGDEAASTATAAPRWCALMPDDPNFRLAVRPVLRHLPRALGDPRSFLPRITEGDKRILLVDGEARGAVKRAGGDGDIRFPTWSAGGGGGGDVASDSEREI